MFLCVSVKNSKNKLEIMCKKHIPTNCGPGSDEVRLFARFSLASKVQRRHPECVLQALNETSASVLGGFDHRLIGLHPQKTVPLFLFNAESSNGRSTIIAGPLPGQDDKVFIDFVDLEVPRLTGWIWGKKILVLIVLCHVCMSVFLLQATPTKRMSGDHLG